MSYCATHVTFHQTVGQLSHQSSNLVYYIEDCRTSTELTKQSKFQQSILQYSTSALCHNFQGKRVTALNFPLCDTCHFPSKTAPINNASVVNLLYASQPTHSGESLFEVGFDEIWLQSQGDLLRGIANIMSENRESNLVYFCSLPT